MLQGANCLNSMSKIKSKQNQDLVEDEMERLTYSGTKEARPDVTIQQILTKLAEYEELEEQGKLPKLPCAVGTTVHEIYQFLGAGAREIWEHRIRLEDLENIGKTVFLSRTEAERICIEKENQELIS